MESVYERDVRSLARDDSGFWDQIDGKRILITGASGLIGGLAANAILERNDRFGVTSELVALVRDADHGAQRLEGRTDTRILSWDAPSGEVPDVDGIDLILHCAATTSSSHMVERPIETIRTIVAGTEAMLELAARTGARMVDVSSMEVYGSGGKRPLKETTTGSLDTMSARSSYPAAKQLAEALCAAYVTERGVHASVARLAQTFGAGVSVNDSHIYAEIARCCIMGTDIVLATDGQKRNMYCYTQDSVRALLVLLARGEAGVAYNVANEDTFCSVLEMAQMAANHFSRTTAVRTATTNERAGKYAVTGQIMLDTTRICELGWEPRYSLMEMYHRMMADWSAYV